MKILINAVVVFIILCSGPVIVFSLARRLLGMTKEQERDHIRRSVRKTLFIYGIAFILPSLFFLVTGFLDKVLHGPMSVSEYLKHIGEYSFQATFNLYADLFSKLSKI